MKKCKSLFAVCIQVAIVFALTSFGILSIIGSAPTPKQITKFSLNLNKSSSSGEAQDRLTARIRPVLMENIKQFPSLYTYTQYGYRKGDYGHRSDVEWIICPVPAFELTITNNTGHVIKFNRAAIKLQDDSGELYDCMMKNDLIEYNKNTAQAYEAGGRYWSLAPVFSKIKSLKIIDNNFELLPGFTQKGYLIFNIPVYTYNSYATFLSSKEYLKVLLFEIPVEMDQAGYTKKTTNFTFVYNVKANTVTVQ